MVDQYHSKTGHQKCPVFEWPVFESWLYLQNSFRLISFLLFNHFHLQVTALLTILLSRLADLYFQLNLKKLLMFLLPFHAVSMIVFSVCILTADPEVNNEGNQEPPQIVFGGAGRGIWLPDSSEYWSFTYLAFDWTYHWKTRLFCLVF